MKFKYFLRGLGVGIIFTSIICLAAYQNAASDKMTDAQVIKRAKQLGMVEQEDKVGDLLKDKNSSEEESAKTEDITQEKQDSSTMEQTSEEDTTKKETTKETTEEETSEKSTEENKSTELETTERNDGKNSGEKETEKTTENETIELVVERGTTSYPVCQKLEALGMIKNAEEFDNYLIENGYANRLRVGTHKLKRGMGYKAIAEAISDPV